MRLIDADKIDFKKVFGGNSEFARDIIDGAQRLIDSQPAAFDKEKVIEEIEESAKLYSLSDRDCEFAVPINVSLEIVEKGGVE